MSSEPVPPVEPATPSPLLRELVTALTYAMVLVAGLLLALLGAFHVASRPAFLGFHWPVAVLVAVVGNLALGLLAGWGLEGRGGAAVAFLGWIVGVGIVMFGGSDDVVIGGSPGDWVPLGFLVAGAWPVSSPSCSRCGSSTRACGRRRPPTGPILGLHSGPPGADDRLRPGVRQARTVRS